MKKILIPLISIFILISCNKSEKFRMTEGMIWNTTYHITYEGSRSLADSVLLTLNRVSNSLNYFQPTSLLSQFNASESGIEADSYLKKVYLTAKRINKETDGYFDPSISPLIDAWGFGKNHEVSADTANIAAIMAYIGMDKSSLEGDYIKKNDSRYSMNFSAIAKGFGCDEVGDMLSRNGVKDFLVEIGGEIVAKGSNPEGKEWRISIDSPDNTGVTHSSQVIIKVTDCSVATSGNYRNFHELDGKRFGHTISPKTGRPSVTDVLSATVVAATCMEADAYATSLMALGSEKGMALADSLHLPVMMVVAPENVKMNTEFEKLVSK